MLHSDSLTQTDRREFFAQAARPTRVQARPQPLRPPRPLRSSLPAQERARNAPPPSMTVIALSRITFGSRPGDIDVAYIDALPGATEEERVDAFIEEQLDPDAIDDSAFEAPAVTRICSATVSRSCSRSTATRGLPMSLSSGM